MADRSVSPGLTATAVETVAAQLNARRVAGHISELLQSAIFAHYAGQSGIRLLTTTRRKIEEALREGTLPKIED